MPIYDYTCERCGPFTALRPVASFRDPCACPRCGSGVPRASLSAPAIAGPSPAGRRADPATSPSHPASCGCCTRRWSLPGGLSAQGARVFTANGPVRR